MNPIFAAALEAQDFCMTRRWRFCFIGGIAVQRWGEPRLTVDVDLTVLTGFGAEEGFVDALLGRFRGRLADAREFAVNNRVLLMESDAGIPLDVSLGAMPFEERSVERSSDFAIGSGAVLTTCSAEDLIVHKAFAGREKDWLDVEGVALRQKGKLDEGMIFRELMPLLGLKAAPESADRLHRILAQARG